MFRDFKGVQNISNNIVIRVRDKAEHYIRFRKAFQKIKGKGLTLNQTKYEFSMIKENTQLVTDASNKELRAGSLTSISQR